MAPMRLLWYATLPNAWLCCRVLVLNACCGAHLCSGWGCRSAGVQSLGWTFGFNNKMIGGVHNLSNESRDVRVVCAVGTLWHMPHPLTPGGAIGCVLLRCAHWCHLRLPVASAATVAGPCTCRLLLVTHGRGVAMLTPSWLWAVVVVCLLQCNPITCCAVSDDKRWIATADAGPDSMIVIWDSATGTPIKTIFNV